MKTVKRIVTTEEVVEFPTPLAPPLLVNPHWQLINPIIIAKNIDFSKQIRKSDIESALKADLRKTLEGISYITKATNKLIAILAVNEMILNIGSIRKQEATFGNTK